jgi:hypothetical protein
MGCSRSPLDRRHSPLCRAPLAGTPRPVFGAVLFPVNAGGGPSDPAPTSEADTYGSGFAQIVHLHQPTANDAALGDASGIPAQGDSGIQIGSGNVAGVPDPDVEAVRITVEIRAPPTTSPDRTVRSTATIACCKRPDGPCYRCPRGRRRATPA